MKFNVKRIETVATTLENSWADVPWKEAKKQCL